MSKRKWGKQFLILRTVLSVQNCKPASAYVFFSEYFFDFKQEIQFVSVNEGRHLQG